MKMLRAVAALMAVLALAFGSYEGIARPWSERFVA
jgi:hypothetical protein